VDVIFYSAFFGGRGYSFRAAFLLADDREMGAGVAEFKGCSRIASTRAALNTSATKKPGIETMTSIISTCANLFCYVYAEIVLPY
jgi:hypothetical protein